MKKPPTPERWAFDITLVLNAALGDSRFPIDVAYVAREFASNRFHDDPILDVKGDNLPGFDGALFRAPAGRPGWGIIYNNRIRSKGRINFTLAHEFGHYLLHRAKYPQGMRCGEQDIVRWDSEYGQVEHQANVFAANFLMPLDDFRKQLPANAKVDLDIINHCRERYGVSFIAATLRWLAYTEKRAVLVVSRDGFILWARSSERALRTRAFFRTSSGPIELPAASLPVATSQLVDGRGIVDHGPDIWFQEPVRELTIVAEQYDFAISLLLLDDAAPEYGEGERSEGDTYDRFVPRPRRREW
jgi:IrrE N-terminal-like domain